MLDFFCSLAGCSMSMSYRVWPSTMATRSSSACVALISIRFIVAFLARSCAWSAQNACASCSRGTPWAFRLWIPQAGQRMTKAVGRPASSFPALRHHGTPRERFCCFSKLQAGGAGAARDVVHRRRGEPPGEGRFRRSIAANMAAPGAVVRRGPESQDRAFGLSVQLPAKSKPYLASRV